MAGERLVIGVDVGGTKVSVAAMREETFGTPVLHPTDASNTEALIAQLVRQVGQVADGDTPEAVGIGVPSVIEFATGRVRSSTNIPLAGHEGKLSAARRGAVAGSCTTALAVRRGPR